MTRLQAAIAVLCSVLLVGGVVYLLQTVRTPLKRATAVLVVPAATETSLADNPDGASRLASTYAVLLENDAGLLQAVARASGVTTDSARRRFRVRRANQDSAVLTVTYRGTNIRTARRGLDAATRRLESNGSSAPDFVAARTLLPASLARTIRSGGGDVVRRRMEYVVVARGDGGRVDAQAANRLAANYAALIPQDQSLLEAAANGLGAPLSSISAVNSSNTSLIQLTASDESYARARDTVLAIASSVTGPLPASPRISPSTLNLARPPSEAGPTTNGSRRSAFGLVGALLGGLLGLVAVTIFNSRHPRLTSVEATHDLTGLPVTDLTDFDAPRAEALIRRWRAVGAVRVRLLPDAGVPETTSRQLADVLDEAAREEDPANPVRVVTRSLAEAFEPVGDDPSAYDVLVVSKGRRLDHLRRRTLRFESGGARIQWLVLVPNVADPLGAARARERTNQPTPA